MKFTVADLDAAMRRKSPGFRAIREPRHAHKYLQMEHPERVSNEYEPGANSNADADHAIRALERRNSKRDTDRRRHARLARRALAQVVEAAQQAPQLP